MSERTYYRTLGEHIRHARERIGWTQLRLAVELGLTSHVAVSHWERANRHPSAFLVDRMEQLFGMRLRP